MPYWNTYVLAHSVPDALRALADAQGPARLVAGGTDLLLDLQQGRIPPVYTLVDITAIDELCKLEIRQNRLFIGAALPLNQVVASPLVQQHAHSLYQAASLIGGPQVRNTATLGGNVAHALPAGDGAISLLALDAQAEVASQDGRRLLPVEQLYAGPGKSTLDPQSELLVGFHLPLHQPGQGSAFQRVMRPQGVAIAILNLSAWIQRSGDTIQAVRIGVGPAGPVPFRARRTEQVLAGQSMNAGIIDQAVQALYAEARFRTSPHRATAGYRQQVARVLLEDVLATAWQRSSQFEMVSRI